MDCRACRCRLHAKTWKTSRRTTCQGRALVKDGSGDQVLAGAGLLYCKDADVTASSFVSYYRPDSRFNTPSILRQSKIPLLVIAGGNDTIVKGLIEAVRPIADGNLISFKVVDDADHFFGDVISRVFERF